MTGTPAAFTAAIRARVGSQHELVPFLGGNHAEPRIEDLDGLGAGRDLGQQVGARRRADQIEQTMRGLRLTVEELLGLDKVLAGLALDGVGRGGERRAGEADERGVAELVLEQPDGFADERRALPGIEDAQPRQVRCAAHGVGQARALLGEERPPAPWPRAG